MSYQETFSSGAAARHLPRVRAISPRDLSEALAKGFQDFWAIPSYVIFLSLIYPLAGLIIAVVTLGYNLLPLVYPFATGFALVGPFAAIAMYGLSRRREQGLETKFEHAFELVQAESFRAVLALGLLLLVIFGLWIAVADGIYIANFGYEAPQSIPNFMQQVLFTEAGHRLILIGNIVGFVFAAVVFSISVVSFPLLIDREIGAAAAVATSIKAVARNPLTMALWAMIIALSLLIGTLPLFVGLAVVLPVLGHATWHLYRKVVVADDLPPRAIQPKPPKGRRYAADFPAVLFPVYDKEPRA